MVITAREAFELARSVVVKKDFYYRTRIGVWSAIYRAIFDGQAWVDIVLMNTKSEEAISELRFLGFDTYEYTVGFSEHLIVNWHDYDSDRT